MVYVGVFTRNRGKVLGVEKAFRMYFDEVAVESVYSDMLKLVKQPRSVVEALKGAVKRAEYCHGLERFDYSVGLEGGVDRVCVGPLDVYIAFHVAYVLDRYGKGSIGLSSCYQVPNQYIDDILRDEMASVLARLTGSMESRQEIGFIGYLSNSLLTRVDLAYEAVRNALIYLRWLEGDKKT